MQTNKQPNPNRKIRGWRKPVDPNDPIPQMISNDAIKTVDGKKTLRIVVIDQNQNQNMKRPQRKSVDANGFR